MFTKLVAGKEDMNVDVRYYNYNWKKKPVIVVNGTPVMVPGRKAKELVIHFENGKAVKVHSAGKRKGFAFFTSADELVDRSERLEDKPLRQFGKGNIVQGGLYAGWLMGTYFAYVTNRPAPSPVAIAMSCIAYGTLLGFCLEYLAAKFTKNTALAQLAESQLMWARWSKYQS